jgi:enoyl-[acyl-carrier-protein] reductase (NADH)
MAAAPLSWVAQVAGAAVFLASDEPAAITGILVSVTSGDTPAKQVTRGFARNGWVELVA